MKNCKQSGFTLIELMVSVVIVGILTAVAVPSYTSYIVKGSRAAAQTQLLQLANLQEKIYLNSSQYSASITNAYNGTAAAANGLGSTGQTQDGKYTLSVVTPSGGQTYTISATPVAGKTQASDGTLTINESGKKTRSGNPDW
jgi:type IV pilus assembly protein PilE